MTDARVQGVGFARLLGQDLDYLVRKYEIVMGRSSKAGQADVVLGDRMNISRQHAKICYNFESKRFELIVLGKNGVTVGQTLCTSANGPVPLNSQDRLVVGEKMFSFLLPKPLARVSEQDLHTFNATASKRPRLSTA